MSVFPLESVYEKLGLQKFVCKHGQLYFTEKGKVRVVAGEPQAASVDKKANCWLEFQRLCHQQNFSLTGYYVSQELADGLCSKTETVIPIPLGYSLVLDLVPLDLAGHRHREHRRALNFGRRHQLKSEELNITLRQKHWCDVLHLEKEWFRAKKQPRVEFLLSRPSLRRAEELNERWFVIKNNKQQVLALTIWIQSGAKHWYLDQMYHHPQAPKLSLDFLLVKNFLQFKNEDSTCLYLGLCPYQGLDLSRWQGWGLWCLKKAHFLFHADGLFRFKKKYASQIKRRYLLLDKKSNGLRQALALGQVTYPSIRGKSGWPFSMSVPSQIQSHN